MLDAVWFKAGTGKEKRFIPIHSLASDIVHQFVIHAMSLCDSVTSFSQIGEKSIQEIWKENWWVDRYAWISWVSIILFGMLFCGCYYSDSLLSVPGEQRNFKYQWTVAWIVYKKEFVWISVAINFGCFSFSSAKRELSNIYLGVSMCTNIEPTVTNWKWTANGRWEDLWRAKFKFPQCQMLLFNGRGVNAKRAPKQIHVLSNVQI